MQHSNNMVNRNPISTVHITTTIIINDLRNLEVILPASAANAAADKDQILIVQHGKPAIYHVI